MTREELAAEAAKEGLIVVAEGATKQVPVKYDSFNEAHRSVAVGSGGAGFESVRIHMGAGNQDKNRVIQFDIANNDGAAVTERVIIGSHLGLADSYIRYGVNPSAADSVIGISDNFGANVQKCQGFSEMCTTTPVFIKQINIISESVTQLNAQFSHKTILPDFTVIPLVQNIAFTREKSDFAKDLNVARGSWLLSSKNFLEFSAIKLNVGQGLTIILEIASISDVRQFVQI